MKPAFCGVSFVPGRGWNVVIEGEPTARFYPDILAALSDCARTVEDRITARAGKAGRVPA